jgi:excisionase family DNA binding protein
MLTPNGYLTMEETSKRLGSSYRTILRYTKTKRLRSLKPGKDRFILAADVEKMQHGKR